MRSIFKALISNPFILKIENGYLEIGIFWIVLAIILL